MKYKMQGKDNRVIVNENNELVATYRQFPNDRTSEIMLKSSLKKRKQRRIFKTSS